MPSAAHAYPARALSAILLAGVFSSFTLLSGCDSCNDGSTNTEIPTTETPTTETPTTDPVEPDWTALYASLESGGTVDPPTQIQDNGNQLFEGEVNIILKGPTETSLGEVFTTKPLAPADPWVEVWISHDKTTQAEPPFPLLLQYVKHDTVQEGQLTQARLDQIRAQEALDPAHPFTLEKLVFGYFAFPTDTAINALPSQLPAGVTARTYEVFTIKGSAAPERSGGLYREIQTVGTTERWRDTWVLYENFLSPYCLTTACDPTSNLTVKSELRYVTGAAASANLKAFLLDAKADRPGPTTGWKYVPIAPYDLITPLPPTVP